MTVHTERRGPVWVVTIDRPEVRNAVDGPTATALADAFRTFEAEDGLLVAVLTGAGGHFCAGADLKAIADDPDRANRIDPEGDGPMGPTRMELDKPSIAAIEGYAVAGGLELALWCDLRVAAETATLGFFDRRWGVPLIDGGTIRITRLIGQSRALDMLLTGRGVPAEEAHEMGLVNRVVAEGAAVDRAVALATEIARFPQAVMRADRRSALGQWGSATREAIAQEFAGGIAAAAGGETQIGADRFAAGHGRHGDFEDI
ncbi:MAG TPA: crotonase/enoyl-CoA hydratase family protein [Actinomycetota bacterium]|nr:crotonase/enoyl-CoA hydratase family protein [Actinomycetota bacterium]